MKQAITSKTNDADEERHFATVVADYQDMVYNTALGIIQNEQDAEEATQDVFIKVYKGLGEFGEQSSLRTWIYKIAINTALDVYRKNSRAKQKGFGFFFAGKEQLDEPVTFHHPGVLLDQKENAAILFKALNKLPEKQKLAFLLQKTEGLNVQEIATIMDTTAMAITSLLARAKENLRKILNQNYNA